MIIRSRLAGEDGTSLIDMVIGMSLMVFFMVMFTGGVMILNKTQQKADSLSQTATQLNQAFLTLDRTVRYADAISTPAKTVSGDWYVELRSPDGINEVCTQLRVHTATKQLQRRTWTVGTAPPSTFMPIASEITNGNEVATSLRRPFIGEWLPPAVIKDMTFQQMTFHLESIEGSNSNKTASTSTVKFTAVNSSLPVPSGAICGEPGTRP